MGGFFNKCVVPQQTLLLVSELGSGWGRVSLLSSLGTKAAGC